MLSFERKDRSNESEEERQMVRFSHRWSPSRRARKVGAVVLGVALVFAALVPILMTVWVFAAMSSGTWG
jgi:hypothetical protein